MTDALRKEVKRYRFEEVVGHGPAYEFEEDPNGQYVLATDYEARVAALEAALRWVNEKYWPGHLRVGNDKRNPCHKGCEGCAWETNVRQALHPTSEAEL